MTMEREIVNDALYSATGAAFEQSYFQERKGPSKNAVARNRMRIISFLRELPPEFTVAEVLEDLTEPLEVFEQ